MQVIPMRCQAVYRCVIFAKILTFRHMAQFVLWSVKFDPRNLRYILAILYILDIQQYYIYIYIAILYILDIQQIYTQIYTSNFNLQTNKQAIRFSVKAVLLRNLFCIVSGMILYIFLLYQYFQHLGLSAGKVAKCRHIALSVY